MMILALSLTIYCLLLLVLWMGWRKAIGKRLTPIKTDQFISVIVPVRNEAENVSQLLENFSRQTYRNFEVIIVDDHSQDNTASLIVTRKPDNVKLLVNSGAGKKAAITTGVQSAIGSIIVTTDADCTIGPDWLKEMSEAFGSNKVKFAFGGLGIQSDGFLFSDVQAIEFSGLIGSGAATAAIGWPTMCNGANLAFRKEVFLEVDGFAGNFHIPSGDDEFLMRKIYSKYPDGVLFLPSAEAVIKTRPQRTIKNFFSQRIRWAGKWKNNSAWHAKLLAVIILLLQLCVIVSWMTIAIVPSQPVFFLLVLKAILEGGFLLAVASFLKIKWNWLAFACLQFVYPIYVVVIGLSSQFLNYEWKGRKIGAG